MKATAKDLRFHSKRILEAAARGEEVIITYRGKARAKIVPAGSESYNENKIKTHKLFGIWKDNKKVQIVEQYIKEIRKGRF
jgi:prevent-host-death family protein